ncbi:MAG: tetratricopeptide repeat protein [Acidobacteriota bacterium]
MTTNTDHPSREVLERFLLAQLPASESRRVLRHLLAGCQDCQTNAGAAWKSTQPGAMSLPLDPALDARYDEVLDRVFQRVERVERVLARERSQARELLAALEPHPIQRQLLMLRNSAKFRSRALCEQLIEASQERGFKDPERALELADLAIEISRSLPEETHGADPPTQLESRAWAQSANAQRILGNHDGAERCFETAEELLAESQGVGIFDEARLYDLKASLRRDQRRWTEALELHDRVIGIYQCLGQRHLLGRAYAQKATVISEVGDFASSISLLRRALELLDPKEEPRMFLAARHNLIWALCESERYREAFALLFHTRPFYLQAGDRMNLLRMRWLEGQVAAGLGRSEQAEVAFLEVRRAFGELSLDFDGALVSLDLAVLLARQGRSTEVQRIAEEVLASFVARSIHREAIVAITLLKQAADQQRAEVDLVRQVSSFLRRSRSNPELAFERGSGLEVPPRAAS